MKQSEIDAILNDFGRKASHTIVFTTDSDFKVKRASASLAQHYQCKACDLVGTPIWNFLGKVDSKTEKEYLKSVVASGKPLQSMTEVPFPSGSRVLATVLFPIMGRGGKVSELLGVSYDITGHHEKEQLVRNKIGVIMGYAEMLGEFIDDDEAREMLSRIRNAGAELQKKLDSK
jgi:hypothetical protein